MSSPERRPPPVRVEYALVLVFAAALIAIVGGRSALRGVALRDTLFWSYSFVVAPIAALVFVASLRYALAGGASGPRRLLTQVVDILKDWLPFLFFLLIYEAFNMEIWSHIAVIDRDAALLRIDRMLFGETPAVLIERFSRPVLTDFLTAAYFLHVVLPPVLGVALYVRDRQQFRRFMLAVVIIALIGSAGYLAVPAVGPGLAYPELFSRDLGGALYRPVTGLLDLARAPRDVFPSLHVGLSAVVLYCAWRLRRLFALLLPLVIGNWIATVYLRYHYAIDVVAGFAAAALAIIAADALLRLEDCILARFRRHLPGNSDALS